MDRFEEVFLISRELPILSEFGRDSTDSDTLCSSCSSLEFSINFDQEMDNQLKRFSFDSSEVSAKVYKKRGRKPLRPGDPIRKKTEIKDKYWLRSFRNFIKTHLDLIKFLFSESQLEFWTVFISKSGKPGKDEKFLSYGKSYKAFLFKQPSFRIVFKAWFVEFGEEELEKKYEKGTDLWFIYYDYAACEIAAENEDFEVYRKALKGQSGETSDQTLFFHIINKNKA